MGIQVVAFLAQLALLSPLCIAFGSDRQANLDRFSIFNRENKTLTERDFVFFRRHAVRPVRLQKIVRYAS